MSARILPPSDRPVLPSRLHHFFENSADRFPNKAAILWNGQSMTYRQLEEAANRLAHFLRSQGIGRNHRVGILLERSFDTYISLLAVHKAGASFVPLDISFPSERIAFIAEDAELSSVITDRKSLKNIRSLSCPILNVKETREQIDLCPKARIDLSFLYESFDRKDEEVLSHIIYTSGSTGRPKGVAITQANICHLVQSQRQVWAIQPEDRVYQGMTIAFDFAHEEIWPGLDAGATLIAGPTDGRRLGVELGQFLNAHRVSVFSCVPSLLATIEDDIPSLRLLMVGGESCPPSLVKKWAKRGRRMLNTYGPTETTCNAASGELRPGRKVTLGHALPGYRLYLLDEHLHPVEEGEIGEIYIGGPGVALGYIHLPDLTKEKFLPDPFDPRNKRARLYKSGDLGRRLKNNEIEFLGRADSQLKIRGYRVEPAEIEKILLEDPRIEAAIVTAWEGNDGQKNLVAYVKARHSVPLYPQEIQARLKSRLPSYMVPSFIDILPRLPLLPSGKIDRNNLPDPKTRILSAKANTSGKAISTPLEKELEKIWCSLFQLKEVSLDADFFNDLGGHSLLAAQAVTAIRRKGINRRIGINDIYSHPRLGDLARLLEESQALPYREGNKLQPYYHSSLRVTFCGIAQFATLFLLSLSAMALTSFFFLWLTHIHAFQMTLRNAGIWTGLFFLALFLWHALPVAAKWALLGRVQPGRYPIWSFFYFRWWLAGRFVAGSPAFLLSGSPFMAPYCRLFGMRIGENCHLGSALFAVPDLIRIGHHVSINRSVHLTGYKIANGYLHIGRIDLEDYCTIASNSVLEPNCRMQSRSYLGAQSCLAEGSVLPAGAYWRGSPAGPSTLQKEDIPKARELKKNRYSLWVILGFASAVLGLIALPLVIALPPSLLIFASLYKLGWFPAIAVLPLAAIWWVSSVWLWIAFLKQIFLPRVKPGRYSRYSAFYLRKWLIDKALELSLSLTHTLYSTLYLAPFLRLLGVKIGRLAEISTVRHITPTLLEIGDGSFIADQASAGSSEVQSGSIEIKRSVIGKRAFVGNSAYLPAGVLLEDNCLIGVLSVPPNAPMQPGTSWFGSPAIFLPQRQKSASYEDRYTYNPPLGLILGRMAVEFFRVFGPAIFYLSIFLFFAASFIYLPLRMHFWEAVLYLTSLGWLLAGAAFLAVVILKWSLIGRYRPLIRPLWSSFVWRAELITGLYEGVVVPLLLNPVLGTPIGPILLRLLGVKIGKRVLLETSFLTEFDLVEIGDDCAVGPSVSLQTHLFEDRIMKMDKVILHRNAAMGVRAIALYSSEIAENGTIEPLSLLMKGEILEEGQVYRGCPARPSS